MQEMKLLPLEYAEDIILLTEWIIIGGWGEELSSADIIY